MELRQAVLSREILRGAPHGVPGRIRAVVYDWQVGSGTATLVAFDDGTTSLYFSNGGGIIGAGEQAPVKKAAEIFRDEAKHVAATFTPTSKFPFPASGKSVFYVVTDSATLTSGPFLTSDLARPDHPLRGLTRKAQDVITELRKAT